MRIWVRWFPFKKLMSMSAGHPRVHSCSALIGENMEEIQATQTSFQKLTEVAGEACSTHFKDIVPKPY